MADNPHTPLHQTIVGDATCNLTYTTDSPGHASIISPPRGNLNQTGDLSLQYRPHPGDKSDRYIIEVCDDAGCNTITYTVTISIE